MYIYVYVPSKIFSTYKVKMMLVLLQYFLTGELWVAYCNYSETCL